MRGTLLFVLFVVGCFVASLCITGCDGDSDSNPTVTNVVVVTNNPPPEEEEEPPPEEEAGPQTLEDQDATVVVGADAELDTVDAPEDGQMVATTTWDRNLDGTVGVETYFLKDGDPNALGISLQFGGSGPCVSSVPVQTGDRLHLHALHGDAANLNMHYTIVFDPED